MHETGIILDAHLMRLRRQGAPLVVSCQRRHLLLLARQLALQVSDVGVSAVRHTAMDPAGSCMSLRHVQ